MGKVGSDATARACWSAGLPTYHINSLDSEFIIKMANEAISRKELPAGHIAASMNVIKRKPLNPIYISGVRDPFARNLSAIFENFPATASAEDGLRRFKHNNRNVATGWFDREFHGQLGIDVYETPFDHELRMSRGENWLIFRNDCDDEQKSQILSEIFHTEVIVKRVNAAASKPIAAAYASAKSRPDFLNRL